jgi:hypothetical protein
VGSCGTNYNTTYCGCEVSSRWSLTDCACVRLCQNSQDALLRARNSWTGQTRQVESSADAYSAHRTSQLHSSAAGTTGTRTSLPSEPRVAS